MSLVPANLSKVTDIISARNSLRFCTEYLGIDGNEFNIIQHDSKYNHHDTIYTCLEQWKNRTEEEGRDARNELYSILTNIQQTRGWFSQDDINSVLEDQPGMVLQERKSVNKGRSCFSIGICPPVVIGSLLGLRNLNTRGGGNRIWQHFYGFLGTQGPNNL